MATVLGPGGKVSSSTSAAPQQGKRTHASDLILDVFARPDIGGNEGGDGCTQGLRWVCMHAESQTSKTEAGKRTRT